MRSGWISLGCPKNQVDTEYMIGLLAEKYPPTPNVQEAEMIIINTCSFIQPATEESLETIMEFAQYKKGRCKLLVVTGCLAQRYGEKVAKLLPEVDLWVGTGEYSRLPELIEEVLHHKVQGVFAEHPGWLDLQPGKRVLSTGNITAYVKIAEGCNNHCLFCIIPQLRGGYRSRSLQQIKSEVEELVAGGVKEIVLVAQDTTAYGQDLGIKGLFSQLLWELDGIRGDFWLRILYTYPALIHNELLQVIKESAHICHYLDLPLQHVEAEVLKAMGRKREPEGYLHLIERIRREIPDIALRSTFILGYPGETEEHFQKLLTFLKEACLDWVGAFPYYQEAGTAAAKLKKQIHHMTRKKRAQVVLSTQEKISLEKNRALEGKNLRVLVEKKSLEEPGLWFGRSYREAPEIDGLVEIETTPDLPLPRGEFVQVEVLKGQAYGLRTRLSSN